MSETSVFIVGICACAVVFATQSNIWAAAGFTFAAFVVWLSSRETLDE